MQRVWLLVVQWLGLVLVLTADEHNPGKGFQNFLFFSTWVDALLLVIHVGGSIWVRERFRVAREKV